MDFFLKDTDSAMSRRQFLKLLGIAGVGFTMPWLGRSIRAALTAPITGGSPKFWVLLHAGGGWDPTSLMDPKAAQTNNRGGRLNNFSATTTHGPFTIAPNLTSSGFSTAGINSAFFSAHQSRLLVLNGINFETNNHAVGPRHIWTGKLSSGFPAFGALYAYAHAPDKPLAFISHGGYDSSENLLPVSNIPNASVIQGIVDPNDESGTDVFTSDTYDRILTSRNRRLTEKTLEQRLPNEFNGMLNLTTSRIGEQELQAFVDNYDQLIVSNAPSATHFPAINATLPANTQNRVRELVRQFAIGLAAYKAGLCAAVNIDHGGFDTHSNHDAMHCPNLDVLVESMRLMIAGFSSFMGAPLESRLSIAVSSDFGRTPGYNGGNGKDHWPIGSMMFYGVGINPPGFANGRVIGGTDRDQQGYRFDPSNIPGTLTPDPGINNRGPMLAWNNSAGRYITPEMIHKAWRAHAGIPMANAAEVPADRSAALWPFLIPPEQFSLPLFASAAETGQPLAW